MGPAFSKLMTKQTNKSSALEPLVSQFTIEDMEFDATVISSGTDSNPVVSNIEPQVASEPAITPNPVPDPIEEVVKVEEEKEVVKIEEKEVVKVEVEVVEVEEKEVVKVEEVVEDKPVKKDKKEKRKKLRKDSL